MKTPHEIEQVLAHCNGTDEWHAHGLTPLLYTDGVKLMADLACAFWLIDVIASYQTDQAMLKATDGFQLWQLKVDRTECTAVVTCRADSDSQDLIRQEIEYTDFPLASIKLYVEISDRVVLLLPSEQ